jgi:8-oxo-dGTP pyrophosphatase MutT (NUDIX family)
MSYKTISIPYKYCIDGYRVLMVKTRNSGAWIFPKGSVKSKETFIKCVKRETKEEAGVTGKKPKFLCEIGYMKGYALSVKKEHNVYKECSFREKKWVKINEANEMLSSFESVLCLQYFTKKIL